MFLLFDFCSIQPIELCVNVHIIIMVIVNHIIHIPASYYPVLLSVRPFILGAWGHPWLMFLNCACNYIIPSSCTLAPFHLYHHNTFRFENME